MEQAALILPDTDDFIVREAYKVLRTNLQFCGRDIRTVAVTSCREGEGKTTVSLRLGKSLAELGKYVLFVDADMRKSPAAERSTPGLSEVLTGAMQLENCVYQTQFETLHLLFAGKCPPNPVELLNSPRFSALVSAAGKVYDYIVIDTPPLGRVIDAAVVAANCDGTILVVGDGDVRCRQGREVVAQLKRSGGKLLGAVRNKGKEPVGFRKYGRP